eukprot:scaffold364858_cov48-Prasinocladus_malaysianus.AAC.1
MGLVRIALHCFRRAGAPNIDFMAFDVSGNTTQISWAILHCSSSEAGFLLGPGPWSAAGYAAILLGQVQGGYPVQCVGRSEKHFQQCKPYRQLLITLKRSPGVCELQELARLLFLPPPWLRWEYRGSFLSVAKSDKARGYALADVVNYANWGQ